MKNTGNITKYIKITGIALIAMFFVVALPVIALADDGDDFSYGGNTDSSSYGGNTDVTTYGGNTDSYSNGGNTDVTTYGGNTDESSYGGNTDEYTYGGNTDEYTYGGNTDEYTYGGNTDTYTPTTSYYADNYYPTTSGYSSGGGYYSGGPSYYVTPTYTQPTSVNVSNSGQTTYVTPTVETTTNTQSPTYYSQTEGNSVYSAGYNTSYPEITSQPVSNQVLAYSNTNPNLASVYLSSVPATGFDDYLGTIIFISILLIWSAILSYIFLKRKMEAQMVLAGVNSSAIKIDGAKDSEVSDFENQIASDNADINKVEQYARTKKVLLSSGASIKLVKLGRQGKINASEFIRSMATGEWKAVGENNIKSI